MQSPLGPSWAYLWGHLGAILVISWRYLEAFDQKRCELQLVSPLGASKSPLLVPSWGALGALLSALGSVWGLCRACLVALLGYLVAIFKPQEPNESKKARRPKTLIFHRFFIDFGLPGASWRGSVDTWGNLGPVLELLIGMLGAILDHRGLP